MKDWLFFISLPVILLGSQTVAQAALIEPASSSQQQVSPETPAIADIEAEPVVLRFTINRFVLEGATLLSKAEVNAAVAPYVGKDKDFSDVQRALEAVEKVYAKRGYSAVHVLLPEQELERGTVRFRVVESRFAKVTVKDNRYFSEASVLNALPSIRTGGVPRSKQIAKELKLANENPARQLNVVLKAGSRDEEIDANVVVTDSKPTSWGAQFDNSGSIETGTTRLGFSYRNANAFDADHVASLQYLTSPQHTDRARVIGGSYKVPLYEDGASVEFFAGYSNINALVGGLSNFQGGGLLFSTRYNTSLERIGTFDPRLSFGLDWRKFKRLEMASIPPTVLYNDIVVTPLSLTYAVTGKFAKSDIDANVSYSINVPKMSKGKAADFEVYDQVNRTSPTPGYKVLRYAFSHMKLVGDAWQFRLAVNGQWSRDMLIEGEKIRLGGANAVRGFSEGSEGGRTGVRMNLESYTPDFGRGDLRSRAVIFYDAGKARRFDGISTIAGAGFGLRLSYTERLSLRVDRAQIKKEGADPMQTAGNWRWHASLNATF